MSKELEAFERIKNHTLSYTGGFYKTLTDSREKEIEDLDIIESALKRNIELEKELCFVKTMEDLTIEAIKDKKLKALEIIKNKVVDMDLLFHSDILQDYNEQVPQYVFGSEMDIDRCLTQEEFDLLKEVLCNGR